jgi:hypothetical protein
MEVTKHVGHACSLHQARDIWVDSRDISPQSSVSIDPDTRAVLANVHVLLNMTEVWIKVSA